MSLYFLANFHRFMFVEIHQTSQFSWQRTLFRQNCHIWLIKLTQKAWNAMWRHCSYPTLAGFIAKLQYPQDCRYNLSWKANSINCVLFFFFKEMINNLQLRYLKGWPSGDWVWLVKSSFADWCPWKGPIETLLNWDLSGWQHMRCCHLYG